MSTIKRDKTPKGEGLSPTFQIRISPELRQQMNEAAEREGVSLGICLKVWLEMNLLSKELNLKVSFHKHSLIFSVKIKLRKFYG